MAQKAFYRDFIMLFSLFLNSRIEKKLSGETYVRQILCGQ